MSDIHSLAFACRDAAPRIASLDTAGKRQLLNDMAAALELRNDLRQRALGHGRRAEDIRVLPGLSLYLASNRSEARALFAQTHARADAGRKFKAIRDMTGLDLSYWPDDRRVTAADLPEVVPALRSRTHADLLLRLIRNEQPTVAELLTRPEVIGSACLATCAMVSVELKLGGTCAMRRG